MGAVQVGERPTEKELMGSLRDQLQAVLDQWQHLRMEMDEKASGENHVESPMCVIGDVGGLDTGKTIVDVSILPWAAVETERQRQHFRQFRFHKAEGPQRSYAQLRDLCRAWLKPEERTKEEILDLLILEHFLAVLPGKMQSWVRECEPETCTEAVAAAEDFMMILEQQVRMLNAIHRWR